MHSLDDRDRQLIFIGWVSDSPAARQQVTAFPRRDSAAAAGSSPSSSPPSSSGLSSNSSAASAPQPGTATAAAEEGRRVSAISSGGTAARALLCGGPGRGRPLWRVDFGRLWAACGPPQDRCLAGSCAPLAAAGVSYARVQVKRHRQAQLQRPPPGSPSSV